MESKNRALMNAPANNNATGQPAPPAAQSTQTQPGLLGEPPPDAAPDAGGVDPSPATEPEAPADPSAEPAPEAPAIADGELLAKAREWQANDYLPDEFLNKLVEVEIKLDDGTKRTQLVTAKEMKDGYIRQSALSRAQTRIHHERQQMQARDTNVRAHFERIQDPDTFLAEYENRGYGQVLENVAIRIAERRVAEREHVNAAGIAAMHKFGCDQNDRRVFDAMQRAERQIAESREHALELRRVAAERDQLASQRKREDHDGGVREMAVSMRKQLDQLRPMAFRAHRIHDNPATQKDFARHLLAQMEVAGSYEVTRDAVMNAARTLSEELEDSRRPAAPQANGRPVQRPLSPTSQIAGRSVANGATRQRKRPSDLMSDLFGKP
jgi:hypothetical protein